MKHASPVHRAAVAVGVLAASLAGGAVAAASDPADAPAGPTGECGWVEPVTVADLPLLAALDELSELSTMSAAVSATDLSMQLDADGPFTIFAPANHAFSAIPENVWDSIIADPELLTSIVGYHVVVGDALSADDLTTAGSVETLSGTLEISADGGALLLNGGESTVTCAGIQTANATVFVVDHVLQPAANDVASGGCAGSSVPRSSVPGVSPPEVSTAPDASTAPGGSVPPGSSVPC